MNKFLKLAILILLPVIILVVLILQTSNVEINLGKVYKIQFKDISTYEDIKKYDGKKVELYGYMTPAASYDTSYTYVANQPYKMDVFMHDDETGELLNYDVIAVVSKDNKIIEYSNSPVKVIGTMKVGNFKDSSGGEYTYRLEDGIIEEDIKEELTGKNLEYYELQEQNFFGLLNIIFNAMDNSIYIEDLEEIGYATKEGLVTIEVEQLDKVKEIAKGLENNEEIVDALNQFTDIAESINKLIENKEYSKLKGLEENFTNAYNTFYEWVGQFKFE